MLELAVLGLLSEQPLHGYELKKRLSETLGPLWGISFGSLYPALRRLERSGAIEAADYEGPVADELVRGTRDAGGIMTLDDLKSYQAVIRAPVRGSYRGYDVVSMPLPSSGGVVLLEMQYPGRFSDA